MLRDREVMLFSTKEPEISHVVGCRDRDYYLYPSSTNEEAFRVYVTILRSLALYSKARPYTQGYLTVLQCSVEGPPSPNG